MVILLWRGGQSQQPHDGASQIGLTQLDAGRVVCALFKPFLQSVQPYLCCMQAAAQTDVLRLL